MTTKEIWRVVPSVPELLASSEGRLMIAPRLAPVNRGEGVRPYGGAPTLGSWDGDRYVYAFRGRTFKVARLICEAFNGAPPTGQHVCMHLDENSRNNAPGNLAWGTQKQNLNAPGFIAYCKGRTGENNPNVKGRRKRAQAA
jgi:hypothetical protein